MRNYFTLDGVDSRDFGVYLSGHGTFGAPSKAYTYHDVPGRNGALIGSEKRYNNIEVTYPAFIYANFKQNISDFRNFLLSRDGYVRLTDTYNSGEFRLASYVGAFEPDVTKRNDAGQFDITFNCMPQRWLTSGQTPIYGSRTSITNPTRYPAKPLFQIYISGELDFYFGDYVFTSTGLADAGVTSLHIDCETMQCYSGYKNINSNIRITRLVDGVFSNAYDFPTIPPLSTVQISASSGTTWNITPRWWQL